MFYKGNDAARVMKLVFLLGPLVFDCDQQSLVEERQFPQALGKGVEAVLVCFKDLIVGFEVYFCPATICMTRILQRTGRRASTIALNINFAVTPNLEIQPFRQGVNNRNANTMQ